MTKEYGVTHFTELQRILHKYFLIRRCQMVDASNGRKGIAKELLSRVVNDARDYGCGTIQITASEMGVKLYTDFGFVHNGNFMQYKL